MTRHLHEYTRAGLVDLIERASEEIYRRGYEAGKFDAAMNRVAEVANEQTKETPQQARDSIVEQAKADIEKYGNDDNFQYTFYYENHSKDKVLGGTAAKIDFVVNREKRTVVCLVKNRYFGSILAKGIAKCAPGDCFNVHIGKAIALRRALGLEIPFEYLSAPQPTEVRVGDKIKWTKNYVIIGINDGTYRFRGERDGWVSGYLDYDRETLVSKIIDDSREGVTQ